VLAFALCGAGSVFAQTSVSGVINANTHWTLANAPYIVTGDLSIQGGAALTIDAGVTVYMGANTGLSVQSGSIAAGGTSANPIRVLSDKTRLGEAAAPGDWNQWVFSSGTSNTRLDYVVFEHGKGLVLRPSKSEVHRPPGIPVFLRAFVRTAPSPAWDATQTR